MTDHWRPPLVEIRRRRSRPFRSRPRSGDRPPTSDSCSRPSGPAGPDPAPLFRRRRADRDGRVIDMGRAFRAARYGRGEDITSIARWTRRNTPPSTALLPRRPRPCTALRRRCSTRAACPSKHARRGRMAMAFGPFKPVGLTAAQRAAALCGGPAAADNAEGTLYNLVGFQTA